MAGMQRILKIENKEKCKICVTIFDFDYDFRGK